MRPPNGTRCGQGERTLRRTDHELDVQRMEMFEHRREMGAISVDSFIKLENAGLGLASQRVPTTEPAEPSEIVVRRAQLGAVFNR